MEEQVSIRYLRADLLDSKDLKECSSLSNDIDFGVAKYGDCNLCQSYLIINDGSDFKIRNVPQMSGGMKYAVDQRQNENSVFFRPCGIYINKQAIIEGKLGTISTNKSSVDIFNLIVKYLKSGSIKVKGYLVGKEAFELYKSGWRLTQNIKSPKEYDLQTP